jgi:hypothetical protein
MFIECRDIERFIETVTILKLNFNLRQPCLFYSEVRLFFYVPDSSTSNKIRKAMEKAKIKTITYFITLYGRKSYNDKYFE